MWDQIHHYGKHFEPYLDKAFYHASVYHRLAEKKIYEHWPDAQTYNRF